MSSIDSTWNAPEFAVSGSTASSAIIAGESLPRTARETQLHRVFYNVLLVYLFMYISRLPELVSWFRIGLILQPILLIGLLMTNELTVITRSRTTRWLLAFSIWIGLCIPFSFWPGGSFLVFTKVLQSLLLVAFILAFIRTLREVARAFTVVGLAAGVITVVSFISSSDVANRQGMGGSASLADPNFYALYLLVGTGFLCLTAVQNRGFVRFLALALVPISLAGILRSGSRAGLLTLVAGVIIFLIYASRKQRTIVVSACAIGLLVGLVFLPESIKTRFSSHWLSSRGFSTLFSDSRAAGNEAEFEANGDVSAEQTSDMTTGQASSEARLYLLRRSLILTAKNPIFGVGPGQFMEAEAADAAKSGARGAWHYTHNTYTQISSECGIPGLVLFTGTLFLGYAGLSSLRRHAPTKNIRQMAFFLQTTYFMLIVGAFFLSLGYGGLPIVMIGFSEAFKRAARRHIKRTVPQITQPELGLAV